MPDPRDGQRLDDDVGAKLPGADGVGAGTGSADGLLEAEIDGGIDTVGVDVVRFPPPQTQHMSFEEKSSSSYVPQTPSS